MDAEKFKDFYESGFGERIIKKEAQYIYGELKDCKRILDIGCCWTAVSGVRAGAASAIKALNAGRCYAG